MSTRPAGRVTSLLVALLVSAVPASAQVVTGTPGSPHATTTISGKRLPAPDPKFGGVINQTAPQSTPWWAPRIVPPAGAPNVLLIMTDDEGFGAPSTFGGVIPTPALDRIANSGLRYTNFHSTSLCSPTRAALITGRNHHSVGFGVVGEIATGYPGYDSHIPLTDVEKIRQAFPAGTYHLYPAGHGFNCTERADFDSASAHLAFERTIEFFRKHVG